MLEGGCTYTHVANVLGVSQSVVSRAWIRYPAFGTVVRQRAATQRENWKPFTTLQACWNRFSSTRSLRSDLLNATGTNVCVQTRNRLHDVNLPTRRPYIRVPSAGNHVTQRQQKWPDMWKNSPTWGKKIFNNSVDTWPIGIWFEAKKAEGLQGFAWCVRFFQGKKFVCSSITFLSGVV